MSRYLNISLLVIATGLMSFIPANAWVKYTSAAGHFSVSFPDKPQESEQDDKNPDGTSAKIHIATYARSNEEVYIVTWFNLGSFFPKDKTMKQMLEESRDGAMNSMKAKKVTTTTTFLGKNPYIEYTFSGEDFIGKERIYLVNKTQYSVIAIYAVKAGLGTDADKFLSSFTYM
jgi:hypothetical protein